MKIYVMAKMNDLEVPTPQTKSSNWKKWEYKTFEYPVENPSEIEVKKVSKNCHYLYQDY